MDNTLRTFQAWDYVVFSCLFVVSSGIGIFFAVKERKAPSKEFLVGGRQMTCVPVALSLTASFMSAVTVLGAPSDVYRFGASFLIFGVAYTFVVISTAELFLPIFYRSGITSTYEYLELRFCKLVRIAATIIYMIQTILYTGVVVYAPALALNQVTGFSLWGSIFATGIVCTFYCTLGGLKAVVWSDAFQMVVMVVGFLTVLVQGTTQTGGVRAVWETAQRGDRLDVFDFDPDPLRRHTFWTISIGGTFTWLGIYGVNQSTIQRCISCRTETHARLALYFNLLGLLVILVCAVFSGLIMYAYFENCDPWTEGLVQAPDQLMPYFVMEILGAYPGLPGLFVACAFSGTLSTVAASINALATVTYEDFVSQCCENISNQTAAWISKGLCIVFGVCCTSMAIAASYMGGIVQAALSIHGMCGGPMLGLFSLGILFPCANSKGAVGGLMLGIAVSFWVGIGAFLYPASDLHTHPLALSVQGCPVNTSLPPAHINATMEPFISSSASPAAHGSALAETWYSMSYLYYSAVGFVSTIVAGLIITFLTGSSNPREVRPGLIRPVGDLFCFCSERLRRQCWCGVDHEQDKLDLGNADMTDDKCPDYDSSVKTFNIQDAAYTNSGFVKDAQA
ncbi:sodium-coupled monocarboxylate transporter 2 [Sardina pilchardus]|uniref:sodium-coupled monocarboxylate transporter 2 n=1 Tax=Sardina pilchardus TaxID=27697 RepID=UPI002E15ECF2